MAKAEPKPAKPGPEHKILGAFAGQWKSTLHAIERDSDDITPADTQGTAEGKLQLDGRFAQLTHTGIQSGKPYEGIVLFGFDDVINKYTAIWMDSTSPAFISYVGTYDAGKKLLTLTSHFSEQVSRLFISSRLVVNFVDADTIIVDEYVARGVGASESHTRSFTYKRV